MNQIKVWTIALATPLRKTFDYLPLETVNTLPPVGVRVRVPFGKRELVGIFLRASDTTTVALTQLKPVIEVLDEQTLYPPSVWRLAMWVSQYYQHPVGEVLLQALPKALRTGKALCRRGVLQYQVTELGRVALAVKKSRAKKQLQVLHRLSQHPLTELNLKEHGLSRAQINKLIEKQWVTSVTVERLPGDCQIVESPLTLNTQQHEALTAIQGVQEFCPFLLAGVTGSGKTEIYLQAISVVLNTQKTALVLVPEISLTPQTVARFERRFAQPIAVLHSGLTEKERLRMWCDVYEGRARIVIGTRSALFAPLTNLGLIIVDEEHDASFKSQSGLRFSARDMAVMRAYQDNIPVVLGSATPSLESFYNVRVGRYRLLRLSRRAGSARLPEIKLVDLKDQPLTAGMSPTLLNAIRKVLAKGKQVLIFLNRRGYASTMLCHHCGHTMQCTRCDAKLIYHASPPRLVCHHCDKVMPLVRVCKACHQAELLALGLGTEQLEQALVTLFPNARVLRIDRDTANSRQRLTEKITTAAQGDADILIGTQMLAKGHHFPNLGLSALVDLDSSFFSIDFRAIERMAQLLVQVAGRAGRGAEQGRVIIQTHQPQHPYLQCLLQQGYETFSDLLLQERKASMLPPFTFQVMVRAESIKKELPLTFLAAVKQLLLPGGVVALGPMPALMERKAGRFRGQLLLQATSRSVLAQTLPEFTQAMAKLPLANRVRWSIDVDPIEVL